MASSSSRSIINHNQFLNYIDEENGPKVAEQEIEEEEDGDNLEEEEESDLLQLKLGLGSDATLGRKTVGNDNNGEESNPVTSRCGSSLGLGLGLKLWPNMEERQEGSEMVGVELSATRRFIGRLPSWQLADSSQDWYNPAHHYSHSGLWFTLHSSTNQSGEALPQVPKAYIRVKNEDMTIFMVKKYLVTKLGLFNENEVEILCMGQRLMNVQSLKVVRDSIWIPALVHSLNSSLADSRGMNMTTPNLMPLLYQKYFISNHSSNYF
ncbi:hypothetical protein K1719_014606 [Acacia pycnantha]|nr:hypothetical protein K1719_014606 [Acacia pycnantha]